jgi:hypothetical protein
LVRLTVVDPVGLVSAERFDLLSSPARRDNKRT